MGVAHLRWVLSSYRRPQREVAKSLQTAILRKLREKLFDWRPDSPPDFNMVVKDRLDELCTNLELMKLNEAGPDQKKDHLLVRAVCTVAGIGWSIHTHPVVAVEQELNLKKVRITGFPINMPFTDLKSIYQELKKTVRSAGVGSFGIHPAPTHRA